MKDNKDDHKQSKTETNDIKSETARDRARRKWKNGLASEQIEKYIIDSIKRKIKWKHHEIRAAAKKYAELGFSVIPIRPFEKTPYIKWKSLQSMRLTPEEINMMWEKYPDAQIGLVTGEVSDLLAVDFDSPEAIENFKEIFGELPDTLCQNTKRGIHVLFKNNPRLRSRNAVIEGLDLKAEGAYFVVAPSIHKSGKHYEWQNFNLFKDGRENLMDMPSEMVEFFLCNQKKTKTSKSGSSLGYDPVPEGERNTRLTQLVGKWINEGEPKEKIFLLASSWNSILEKPLEEKEVEAVVESVIRTDMRNNPGRYENKKSSNLIEIFTASELIRSEFPEPKWAIPGILPEGLNILGGKPKVGKSIFALNACIAVALGGKAFNKIDVEKGSVIYLALEDTPKRLQRRLRKMVPKGPAWIETDNLLIARSWPRMNDGGLALLQKKIGECSDIRLVIIDTFVKFRPVPKERSGNPYEIDYEHVSRIKDLADEDSISILLIHHLRKMEGNDVFDTFSGTFGLTGAADGLLALIRKQGRPEIHITGRDIENAEYALEFDAPNMCWNLLGKAEDVQSSIVKQEVYNVLQESDDILSPKELSELTGLDKHYVQKALGKLVAEGKITKEDRGKYKGEGIKG